MKKPVLTLAVAFAMVLGGSAVAIAATSTSTDVAKLAYSRVKCRYSAPPVQADRRLGGVIQDGRGNTIRRHCQGQLRPVTSAGTCLVWSHLDAAGTKRRGSGQTVPEHLGLLTARPH